MLGGVCFTKSYHIKCGDENIIILMFVTSFVKIFSVLLIYENIINFFYHIFQQHLYSVGKWCLHGRVYCLIHMIFFSFELFKNLILFPKILKCSQIYIFLYLKYPEIIFSCYIHENNIPKSVRRFHGINSPLS